MKLRKLEWKDAVPMFEWMNDEAVTKYLETDFASKSLEDCEAFIAAATDTSVHLHLAVADDNDTYMGTVSLKHMCAGTAEFAIAVCRKAMGKGYSGYAMKEIIRVGFEKRNLERVYWRVKPENCRAIRFYDKSGYRRVDADSLKFGGGRRHADFCLSLVSGNKGSYGRRSLPNSRTVIEQLYMENLFLPENITMDLEGKEYV